MTDALIIGIGNRYRGDDALGCLIADDLRDFGADAVEHDGEPAALIDLWQGRGRVILVDAVSSGAPAGTIHRIDLRKRGIPGNFRSYSTHAFGISEAVELARALGKLPSEIVFYGIEGADFSGGETLSAPLQEAVEELKSAIIEESAKEDFHA